MGRQLTTLDFIQRAIVKHGAKYDYSKVNYTNKRSLVKIICPVHGEFLQVAGSHLTGRGCVGCWRENSIGRIKENRGIRKKCLKSSVVPAANVFFDGKYDYSLVPDEFWLFDRVSIICPIHGVFEQEARSHFKKKCGCRECNLDSLRKRLPESYNRNHWIDKFKCRVCTFYIIRCFNSEESFIKIGITSRSIKDRFWSKKAMPYQFEILFQSHGDAGFAWDLELKYKRNLRRFKYVPLIEFQGSVKECFSIEAVYHLFKD